MKTLWLSVGAAAFLWTGTAVAKPGHTQIETGSGVALKFGEGAGFKRIGGDSASAHESSPANDHLPTSHQQPSTNEATVAAPPSAWPVQEKQSPSASVAKTGAAEGTSKADAQSDDLIQRLNRWWNKPYQDCPIIAGRLKRCD